MADIATIRQTYRRRFARLVLIDFVTIAAVYALVLENTAGSNLLAGVLLVGVVCAQTIVRGPFQTIIPWVTMLPIAFVMGVLIGAYPALDWSGPGEADEMTFAPIYPVIATVYAIGVSLIAGLLFVIYEAVRKRPSRAGG